MSVAGNSIPRRDDFLILFYSRDYMTKKRTAAALILTGFLFAAGGLFAQNHAANPAEFAVTNADGLSLPRPVDSGAIPVFKITPGESKIKFDVEASVSIVGTF